jgi:hypothetical protein
MDNGTANYSLRRKILPGLCSTGNTSLACICGAASTFCQTQGPVSEAWAYLPLSLRPRNFLEKELFHGLHGNREPLPPVCSHESLYSQNVKYSNRMMTRCWFV